MPLIGTKAASSAQGFGLTLQQAAPNYIEDVFSTWLYTGNNTSQAIANGVDLLTKGGMVWTKARSSAIDNLLWDTARGVSTALSSNKTNANMGYSPYGVSAFNNNGFTASGDSGYDTNNLNVTFASWTFRKQPKFFDVVTWTGNGVDGRAIPHSLGSVPGVVMVKRTDTTGSWKVTVKASSSYLRLNSTDAANTLANLDFGFCSAAGITSTSFTVDDFSGLAAVNASGGTYVAYVFASNAGGFGLTGSDNVISCGSYTGNGSATGPVVSLGYEPQWLMVKNASGTGNWNIIDNMRGMPVGSADAYLEANTADAEATAEYVSPTATGFQVTSTSTEVNTSASTYVYIAIRRGPMKVPTTGTSVFSPNKFATNPYGQNVNTGFPVDMSIVTDYSSGGPRHTFSRIIGTDPIYYLDTDSTAAEANYPTYSCDFDNNTGFLNNTWGGASGIFWNFRRAPGFFDEVCYTGTGANRTVAHNLTVAPQLMIVKSRSTVASWAVYQYEYGPTQWLALNTPNAASTSSTIWNNTAPTSSSFSVGTSTVTNASAANYVAYLFASCPGVCAVGSYSGTGSSITVNCGFASGARFVLIKISSAGTGSWFVWDTARGMVSGTDPYLQLNTTDAEVNSNSVYSVSTGFQVVSTDAAINGSGRTYIYLAIA